MSRDDEWAAWARDFQDASDAAPAPEAMLAVARRETRRLRVGYAMELLASVGLVAFYVVMMRTQRATWFVAMASANFVFAALWMGYLTHVRRGTWSAAGSDVRTFAALTRARRVADVRWLRFARAVTAVMLLFVAGWAPFVLRARWALYRAEPWRAVVGFGVAALIGVAVLAAQTRKLARAERELARLDDPDAAA
ncbi:MAG: hypothetical protein U0325_11735 [Polyangiales bacterium]